MEMNRKNKKGILLTLLVIVLFVLMMSEIITYIVININYGILLQSASASSTQGSIASFVTASIQNQLHQSLATGLATMATLQSSPAKRPFFFNNSQYFLTSLVNNGTAYGTSYESYMGKAVMNTLTSVINAQLSQQSITFAVQASNLSIYQGTPSTVNATYTALALINSSASGTLTLPISVSTSVSLNGTTDIVSLERASNYTININPIPTAYRVGGTAIAGSTGPFQFAFGTVITRTGVPVCGQLPFKTANYIVIGPHVNKLAAVGGCGVAGIISNTPNSLTWNIPYLIFPSSSPVFSIPNGTQILLNGPGLSVYNISALQSAIQNNQYFGSQSFPSYLDQINGGATQKSLQGLFSFNLLGRQTPYFTDGNPISNVLVAQNNVIIPGAFTISFWVNPNAATKSCDSVLGAPSGSFMEVYLNTPAGCAASISQGDFLTYKYVDPVGTTHDGFNSIAIQPQTWTQASIVFAKNTIIWYINGNKVSTYANVPNPTTDANAFIIGAGDTSFNGSVADVQVYNAPLTNYQIQQIFQLGISGYPVSFANVIAWYPLNGNGNDYGAYGYNGTVSNAVVFKTLTGYTADPILSTTTTNFNTSEVEGVLNCGTIDQCSVSTLPHLYLSGGALEVNGTLRLNESAALGLGNAVIPRVLAFTSTNFVQENLPLTWMKTGTQSWTFSIWVYPKNGNGVIVDEYNGSASIHNPFISIGGGTAYVGYGASSCQNLGAIGINRWTNIQVSYNGISDTIIGAIDGEPAADAVITARSSLAFPAYYDLGKSDASNCGSGSGATYNGLMADFQVYNSALTQSNMLALYLNDTLPGQPANVIMPLGNPANGAPNQTAENVQNNFGVFYQGSSICSVVNAVTGSCGLYFTQP